MTSSKDSSRHSKKENLNDLFLNKFLKKKKIDLETFNSFSKFITPNVYKRYLQRYELYKLTKNIEGSIFECGIGAGGGLFNWILCKEIIEPFNHTKKIIGFDTFSGFPSVSKHEKKGNKKISTVGSFSTTKLYEDVLSKILEYHAFESPADHIKRHDLVKGDASKTIKII